MNLLFKPPAFVQLSKCLTVTVLMALFWQCGSSSAARQQSRLAESYKLDYYSALQDIETGRFESALIKLDSVILQAPDYANAHKMKGWLYSQQDEAEAAVAAYETALRYDDSDPGVWIALGNLYIRTENYDRGIYYLKKAVRTYPDSAALHLDIAEAYYLSGQPDKLFNQLKFYKSSSPELKPAYWKWNGLGHYLAKRYDRSISALEQYIADTPDDRQAIKYIALSKFESGDYESAISLLNRIAANGEKDPEIYLYRSRYFFNLNKPDNAWEQLNHALSFDGLNSDILFEVCKRHYEAGNYRKSEKYIQQLISIDPNYWPAYRYLGFLEEKKGNSLKAGEHYQLYLDNHFQSDSEVLKRLQAINAKSGN